MDFLAQMFIHSLFVAVVVFVSATCVRGAARSLLNKAGAVAGTICIVSGSLYFGLASVSNLQA